MLYKLSKTDKVFDAMEPMPFKTFADCGQVEKDLENLLAENLLEVLFESSQLMPIFQERSRQEEADIYAVNRNGDLIIFELKRATAGGDAVHQALRYCETAAHWDYAELQRRYRGCKGEDLQADHKESFGLDTPLSESDFNRQQHLMVVGGAGSDDLVRNIDYWKSKGIAIDFVPYRIYEIGGEHYFEFFSPPYDSHSNPAHKKGVIFDTCRTYSDDSIWYMCENDRVAAFGGQSHVVNYLNKNDIVFLYHTNEGIIAAGRVKSDGGEDTGRDALYRDLEWLTAKPTKEVPYTSMPARQIKQVLNREFYWRRTIKTPYLSKDESDTLLKALICKIGPKP